MHPFKKHLLFLLLLASCQPNHEFKTENGFRYIKFTDSKGSHPEIGKYLTLDLVIRTHTDSLIFDSRQKNLPFRFQFVKIPFKGSYEDGLQYLAEGDSAIFYVPADSLYNYFYPANAKNRLPQNSTAFKQGTELQFHVNLIRIQPAEQVEMEQMLELSKLEREEDSLMKKYVADNNLSKPDTSGYYLSWILHGNGPRIDSGMTVTVTYTGRYLTGKIFSQTQDEKTPYRFVMGTRQIVEGWDLAFRKLRVGDKIKLVLPSKLAYGEKGLRNPANGTYIIIPYSALQFEIKILSVENQKPGKN